VPQRGWVAPESRLCIRTRNHETVLLNP